MIFTSNHSVPACFCKFQLIRAPVSAAPARDPPLTAAVAARTNAGQLSAPWSVGACPPSAIAARRTAQGTRDEPLRRGAETRLHAARGCRRVTRELRLVVLRERRLREYLPPQQPREVCLLGGGVKGDPHRGASGYRRQVVFRAARWRRERLSGLAARRRARTHKPAKTERLRRSSIQAHRRRADWRRGNGGADGANGLGGGDKEESVAVPVAIRLLRRQRRAHRRQRGAQPRRVDEREQRDGLPRVLFPVEVVGKVDRVKVDDWRVGVHHQLPVRGGQRVARRGREDGHQLLEGGEGGSLLEGAACEVGEVDEVRGAGRVVEGEVPPPVLHPLVVVHEHPAQPLHVVRSDGAARGLVLPRHLELGRIVPLLPVPLAVPDGIHLRILLRLPRLQQLLHPRLVVVRRGRLAALRGSRRGGRRSNAWRLLLGQPNLDGAVSRVGRGAAVECGVQVSRSLEEAREASQRQRVGGDAARRRRIRRDRVVQLLLPPLLGRVEAAKGARLDGAPAGNLARRLCARAPLLAPARALEDLVLVRRNLAQQHLRARQVHSPCVGEVPAKLRHQPLVREDQHVDRAVADLEGGDVRQEVVADEEAEKDKIVDHALEVKAARHGAKQVLVRAAKLLAQVLAEHPDLQHLQLWRADHGAVGARLLLLGLRLAVQHHLAQDGEVRLVRRQGEHDQIRVQPVDDMP
mmetsp:Transcript_25992/g.77430  ORF Transcript_25992/g.77430 Transcript_25992/m.77430 type:complete len:692 (+) Transcript_25992:87-2162(+)